MSTQEILFFAQPAAFRNWLAEHHGQTAEQWVGYYKKGTGKPSITWPESVDEALCFGWIDGLRKSIDEESYKIRFTPRRPGSHWSEVNIKRMEELKVQGLVKKAGLEAYDRRKEANSARASYEQGKVLMPKVYEKLIRRNKAAWTYYSDMPPGRKKQYIWWVVSAKKEETQHKRVQTIIDCSARQEVIPPLRWSGKKK